MCIICRNGDPNDFLSTWHQALSLLKEAERIMHDYGKTDKDYDAFHKKIVRARKNLAKLEQERELTTPSI